MKCKYADYTKGSPVRLKYKAERKTLLVKGMKKESEGNFSNLIQDISKANEKIKVIFTKQG